MAFLHYLRRRAWLLPLLVVVAYIATDTVIHLRFTYTISENHITRPPVPDNTSPTGYELGERDVILPYTGMDGYHWIMQTQQMFATGDLRIRHVDYDNYDNGPKGREVHWASAFRWWSAALAWLDHVYRGTLLPVAVENVMPFANTLLITLLLIPLAPVLTRRFGLGAASLVLIGMGAILPVYEAFAEGKSDHHGLAALNDLLTLLFLLGGGAGWVRNATSTEGLSPFLAWLPDRAQAKRWFIASGIVGGFGLWISTASEAPLLAEIGLAAFVATGWLGYNTKPEDGAHPDPSLWRVWGWAGAAASIFFYLVEYFPSHMELRLEVNNPLYAAAWAGGCEIIYRVCRWWNGGRLAENKRDWAWLGFGVVAVATVPLLVYFFSAEVFWIRDTFLFNFHEDYIAEFKDLRRYLDPMYAGGSGKYMLAILNPLILLAVPMTVWVWRRLRVAVLTSVAVGLPMCGLAYWAIHLHSTSEVDFLRDYALFLVPLGILAFTASVICLIKPQWEKATLLIALALGLLGYNLFLLVFQSYLAAHPADWPLDYYFWPFETIPLAILACLLFLWEPWSEFPRPAQAIFLLALPPIVITMALSIREMRWMEQEYSMLLATLGVVAAVLARLRGYRWSLLPLTILAGLLTIVLGQVELHWGQLTNLQSAALLNVTNQSFQSAPHLAVLVALVATLLVVVGAAVGRFYGLQWKTLIHAATLMLLPPVMLAVLFYALKPAWLGVESMVWISALLVVLVTLVIQANRQWKIVARTFAAVVFLGAVYLPSPMLTTVDWLAWTGPVPPMSDVEVMELVTRDVAQSLRVKFGNKTEVVVSGPTTTTWMSYWGDFKGLGDLYWENLEGLKADRDIYAAQTPEAAHKLIQEKGVNLIAIYSWDPFYKEYARLALNVPRPYNPDDYQAEKPLHDWLSTIKDQREPPKNEVEAEKPLLEHSFVYSLIEKFEIPNWLRLIYYPMPGNKMLQGSYVVLFEVVPPQSPEAAATNLAEFHVQRGDQNNAIKEINAALTANPNYLPALICAARLDINRNKRDELQLIFNKILALLPLDNSLTLEDHLNLAMDFVLAGQSDNAKPQIEAAVKLANSTNIRRLDVEQLTNFISFIRQTGLASSRPGLSGFIFDLLPDTERADFLIDAGRAQIATNLPAAVNYFRRALTYESNSLPALTELASLLATTKNDALRNGTAALDFALRARDLDQGQNAEVSDALACAYAETAQFNTAVNLELLAIRQAKAANNPNSADQAAAYTARLQLFKNHQPFHQ